MVVFLAGFHKDGFHCGGVGNGPVRTYYYYFAGYMGRLEMLFAGLVRL